MGRLHFTHLRGSLIVPSRPRHRWALPQGTNGRLMRLLAMKLGPGDSLRRRRRRVVVPSSIHCPYCSCTKCTNVTGHGLCCCLDARYQAACVPSTRLKPSNRSPCAKSLAVTTELPPFEYSIQQSALPLPKNNVPSVAKTRPMQVPTPIYAINVSSVSHLSLSRLSFPSLPFFTSSPFLPSSICLYR